MGLHVAPNAEPNGRPKRRAIISSHTSYNCQSVPERVRLAFGYSISYWMPKSLAPWDEARVHGTALTVEAATTMILTAIRRSGASSQILRDAVGFRYYCPSCGRSSFDYSPYCGHCRAEWPKEMKMQAVGLYRL